MASQFIETLQRMVEEETRRRTGARVRTDNVLEVGGDDLTSPVELSAKIRAGDRTAAAETDQTASATPHTWYVLRAELQKMPTHTQFLRAFTYQRDGWSQAPAVDGVVTATERDPSMVVGLFSVVRRLGNTGASLTVTARGPIQVFVDGTLVASDSGQLRTQLSLVDKHDLLILTRGGHTVTAELGGNALATAEEPMPDPPRWDRPPSLEFLNSETGQFRHRLSWFNDPHASSWSVYRGEASAAAGITSATDNLDGTITLQLDAEVVLRVGEDAYVDTFFAGRIQELGTVDPGGGDVTTVRLSPSMDAPHTPAEWVGLSLLSVSHFTSIARIADPGASIIRFDDSTVKSGVSYFYKLTAFGLLAAGTESDFSVPKMLVASDNSAPGALTNVTSSSFGDIVVAAYTAPADDDFVGVRVYGPYAVAPASFEASHLRKTEYSAPGGTSQTVFLSAGAGTYYLVPFDSSGNEVAVGVASAVTHTVNDGLATSPSLEVTPVSSTPHALTFSWDATAESLSVTTLECRVEYTIGGPTDAAGTIVVQRPDKRAAAGVVTWLAERESIKATHTIVVPNSVYTTGWPDPVTGQTATGSVAWVLRGGSSALLGSAPVTGLAQAVRGAQADVQGEGTATAASVRVRPGTSGMSGQAQTTSAPVRVRPGSSGMDGLTQATSAGDRLRGGAGSISGAAQLTAAAV